MSWIVNRIRNIGRGIGRKISHFNRGLLYVTGTLLGFKYRLNGNWDNRSAGVIGWIFLAGMPIGILILGPESFSVISWLAIVVSFAALCNLEEACELAAYIIENGPDGAIEEEA